MVFFEKPICFWNKSPNFPLFWEILIYSVAFFRKVATFSDFKSTLDIFWKNAAFFRKPKFWEILLIRLHPAANFSYLSIFKKSQIFIEKRIFFSSKTNFWTFWEILLIQLHSAVNFLTLSTFFRKLRFFFEKHIQVLSKEQPIFERFEKSYSFSRNFHAYLLPLATFQKNILFSKEPSFFFKKNINFLNGLKFFTILIAL